MKFTAFIISSILATPVPYYATEVDSVGQEKSANSYKNAYNPKEQGVDETKAAYGDVRAIGDNRHAYSPKEQVSGENRAAYGNFKSIGDVKSGGGENKQAYGDVKSIDDINVDIDYTEEWNPVAIDEEWEFNDENNLEAKNGNQGYSSGMVQDWDTSTRQISHENEDWDGMNRDNQEWSYMPNDNQGWKNMNNNIRAWNSMQNVKEKANKMDRNEWGSTRQRNGKMFQRHAIVCRQKY
ncbi:hypothetical protein DSO57_1023782 [Entomophthora muscae]|uniref:Uncharacterized protein n=1 Tax=Entomophthora muscae TaxID=34485 RepID=A0ACC2U192_9FUNG|nr:hypothetical protein DSO57_1023782 [Entomophthora muscae]